MSKKTFDFGSFKYESISHRMERLKHSQSHSSSILSCRTTSLDQLKDNKTPIRSNPIQTNILSFEQQERYLGRVTKNTGIKKYNQRMLKQVGKAHRITLLKENYLEPASFNCVQNIKKSGKTLSPKKNKFMPNQEFQTSLLTSHNALRSIARNKPILNESFINNLKQKQEKLEPGKIYSKDAIQRIIAVGNI